MFYYASKIGWFFVTPSNLLISLVILGILLAFTRRWRRFGLGLALGTALATVAFGLLPISSYLLLPLEERFPAYRDDGRRIDGIILLGGSVRAAESASRGTIVANESAERVLETIALAHRYPEARILISGGGGTVFEDGIAEAPIIAAFLTGIGIDRSRILVEGRSRTTAENALYTRPMLDPSQAGHWLLVTSAWHMPRAMGAFRKVGLNVVPYPVDYRTSARADRQRPFAFISEGLQQLDVAAKEWAGLVGYFASGRTSSLFPGPEPLTVAGDANR